MPKYHDEFNIDDDASEISGSIATNDEESARVSVSGDSVEATPGFSFESKSKQAPPLEPPISSTKKSSSRSTIMTTFAAHDGGEDFSAEIHQDQPSKGSTSRMARWILIAAVVLLIAAAVGALITIMGGGDKDEGSASSVTSNENTNIAATTNPTPAPVDPTPVPVAANPPPSEPATTVKATSAPTPAPVAKVPVVTSAPTTEIFSYIKSRLPDGGLMLKYSDSYQSVSLKYVEDTYDPAKQDIQRVMQRFVLACIYFATNNQESAWTRLPGNAFPHNWKKSTGWVQEENECTWYGITCNDQGRVTVIDLSENFLSGTFPPETALLKGSLKSLILRGSNSYNHGEDGIDWIGDLTLLEDLDLFDVPFQYDGIPTSFAKLTNLVTLDISYTLMHGELKGEVFKDMKKLKYLTIGGNSYNTPLPSTIANLTSLAYFYADFCDLEGDLTMWTTPDQTPALKELWIYDNPKVSGQIPVEVGQYSNLASLAFTSLNLTGPIPSQVGNLMNMEQLWLYSNKLYGKIPTELGNMPKLQILEVWDNDLTGDMPEELCINVLGRQIDYLWADCTVSQAGAEINCSSQCCACCGDICDAASGKGVRARTLRKVSSPKSQEERRVLRHAQRRERLLKLKHDPVYAQANAEHRMKRIANAQTLTQARKLSEETKK